MTGAIEKLNDIMNKMISTPKTTKDPENIIENT